MTFSSARPRRGAAVFAILVATTAFTMGPLLSATAANGGPTGRAATAGRVVTIEVTNFAFLTLPKSLPAGRTTFRLVNKGTKLHHLQLLRLPPNGNLSAIYADFVKGFAVPAPHDAASGPSAAWGGQTIEASVVLQPGKYAVLCWVPAPDGKLHLMKGMMGQLEVTANSVADTTLPKADVTVTARDYGFVLSTPIRRGRQTIRLENVGPQAHELVLVKLSPGKRAADARDWSERGQEGPPPGTMLAGLSALAVGGAATVTNDFAPGEYALLCFMPDTKRAPTVPHAHRGMMMQFTVR